MESTNLFKPYHHSEHWLWFVEIFDGFVYENEQNNLFCILFVCYKYIKTTE